MVTASASAAPTVCIGLRLEYGSWKTICTVPRSRRRSLPGSLLQSPAGMPSMMTCPLVACSRPISTRASVVLPEPDSPTRPTDSPAPTSSDTPSTAVTVRLPCLKTFRRSLTWMSGSLDRPDDRGGGVLVGPLAQRRHLRADLRQPDAGGQAAARHAGQRRLGQRTSASGGAACSHSAVAHRQRGANGHEPATRSGAGTEPGIETRSLTRWSAGGSDSSSP